MNTRPLLIANTAIVAAMTALSVWAWKIVPEAAKIPLHWNIDGNPDRFGSKFEALLVMPGMALAITLLLVLLPNLDPRRSNVEASAKFWNATAISVALFLAYIHVLLVLGATGQRIDVLNGMIPALCLLFAVIGNYLSKTRSNWFAGIRTPWTLSSEYSWEKTHRWAGRLFVGSSLATAIAWLTVGPQWAIGVLVVSLLVTSLVTIALSYVFYKQDPDRASD